MGRYRLLPGETHHHGGRAYSGGEVIECDMDLCAAFNGVYHRKFERLDLGENEQERHMAPTWDPIEMARRQAESGTATPPYKPAPPSTQVAKPEASTAETLTTSQSFVKPVEEPEEQSQLEEGEKQGKMSEKKDEAQKAAIERARSEGQVEPHQSAKDRGQSEGGSKAEEADFDSMTQKELVEYATKNDIDLKGCRTKADMAKACREAQSE
jgi:hypothetical protein